MVYPDLIKTTRPSFRMGWSEDSAHIIGKEFTLKLWCHSSIFEVSCRNLALTCEITMSWSLSMIVYCEFTFSCKVRFSYLFAFQFSLSVIDVLWMWKKTYYQSNVFFSVDDLLQTYCECFRMLNLSWLIETHITICKCQNAQKLFPLGGTICNLQSNSRHWVHHWLMISAFPNGN